ncbi:radical SAM protein [Candidatus Thorarchaeota archaeon]|nr:MAG: radical SAM protein [Candidatus Thorarchaeota archaeon]
MQYEGSIWRPPSEARSLILQATVGCSHNACIYCVSYKQKKFRVRGAEGIRHDLQQLSSGQKSRVKRVFLADGNALAMTTDEMADTLDVLSDELPRLQRVGTYAYARDVDSKSISELKQLHKKGLGIVYLGLETGDDDLLSWVRKGVSSRENAEACKKIRKACIPLSLTIILGLGGKEHSERHAKATAAALNEIDPEYVGALTLMTPPGTAIHEMVKRGEFRTMSSLEILRELRTIVADLELTSCIFRTNHASNYLPVRGTLNRDKERVLDTIDKVLEKGDLSSLRSSYLRGL